MPTPTSRSVEARRTAVARALAAVASPAPAPAVTADTVRRLDAIEASLARIEAALDRIERSRPTTPRRDRGRLHTLPEVPSPDVALAAVLGEDAGARDRA